MSTEKQKQFLIRVAYFGVIAIGLYFALRYLLSPLMPFLIGFVIAWLFHKPSRAIAKKLHVHARIPALLITILFYLIVFSAMLIGVAYVITAVEHFIPLLPELYTNQLLPFILEKLNELELWLGQFDPSVAAVIDNMAGRLFASAGTMISNLSVTAVKLVSSIIAGLPSVILSIILTVVATCFSSMDFDKITGFFKSLLPQKTASTITETVVSSVDSIRKIIVSYMLIMLISFVELSIGFLVMKIPYAIALALIIAIVDIMPVLGTGLFLIPWSIIAAVLGNVPIAVGMAILYIVMLIVRNTVEPKLVGMQMGLHPLATLISMFIGLEFFGLAGMLGFPITLSLLVQFRKRKNTQTASSHDHEVTA